MMGVLGGTFDPVHFGHLRPALEVRQDLGLREVRLIPLCQAVHRPQPLASPAQRLAMLKLAVAGEPGMCIDDRELRRPGASYTYETLVELRSELGPEEGICLLLGADAFAGFLSWHRPDDILSLAHLVVMGRPGDTHCVTAAKDEDLRTWAAPRLCSSSSRLAEVPSGRIWFQDVTSLAISATRIRRLVALGLSPRYLLPDAVIALIVGDNLYR
ncbi:MAG: nicotinate-nucleotide adenylyltransferase [Chromatiaceae bacterium]